jgi:hypothetical protein
MLRKMTLGLSLAAATIFSANAATVRGVVEDNARRPNPIAGAVVTLTSAGDTATVYRDTADETGAYRISVDNSGTYAIAVTKTGYTPDQNNDQSVRLMNPTSIVVVDLVMIARSSGTIVKGTITDSLSNAYLIGAKLNLQQSAGTGWRTIDSTVSITGGAYTFDSVASGSYRIQAALKGYLAKTAGITVRTDTLTADIKLLAVVIVKISGAITDSLSNANLTGAKLILQQRTSGGSWDAVDTTTSANGAYLFDTVEANTYRIIASLNGYSSKTTASITVSANQNETLNIKLLEMEKGKITGKVTGDSAKGAAISGAQVILESASGTVTAIDTVTTDASGVYLFTTVETGLNYDITVSKTGYIEKTVRHSRQTAGTDTVDIILQKIATGSIYVKVRKQADSAAIVGASVTVGATGTAAVTETAGSNGVASFVDLATGTYTITISAAGCVPIQRTGYRLLTDGKDTLQFYLAAATGGTKVLMGTVIDSSSKAAVANARVALTIQSGGASFILIDSTDATGKFSISGIPAAVYTGSVAATRTTYRNYTNSQITIGQPNQADTGRLTITMVRLPTGIIPHAAKSVAGAPEISVAGAARLKLSNFSGNGIVSLFSMNGKVVYRANITPYATMLILPPTVTSGLYVVTVTQKNALYRQQVIMP